MTTRTQASRLAVIARALLDQARRTGKDKSMDLFRGARVSARVRDGEVCLVFARCAKPLGDTELATFVGHCGVPEGARRLPAEGQGTHVDGEGRTWHRVGYVWADEEGV